MGILGTIFGIAKVAVPLVLGAEQIFGRGTGDTKKKVVGGQMQIALDQMLAAGKIKPEGDVDVGGIVDFVVDILNNLGVLDQSTLSKVVIRGKELRVETENTGE